MLQTPRLIDLPSSRGLRRVEEPRRRRSGRRYLLRAALVVLVLFAIGLGALVAVLYNGPVSVGFIRSRVEASIAASLGPGYSVVVGETTVGLDPVLGFNVDVSDLVLRDEDGVVVASMPSTRLAVDPLALLTLRVAIRSVEVSDAVISLVQTPNSVRLGVSAGHEPAALPTPAPARAAATDAHQPDGGFAAVARAVQLFDRGVTGSITAAEGMGFRRFSVLGGTVNILDAETGALRSFSGAEVTVERDAVTSDVSIAIAASGYSGRWTANADRTANPATGEHQLSAVFSQLALSDLFPAFAADGGTFSTDIPLYGRAVVDFAADDTVKDATIRLDLGAGTVRVGAGRETVLLDEATIRLRWDIANDVIVLEPSTFYFGQGRAMLGGWLRPAGTPEERRYAFSVNGQNATLAPRDSPAPPIIARDISLAGEANFSTRLVRLDTAQIVLDDGAINVVGTIGLEGRSPSVALAASISPMSMDAVKQIWPPFLVPGARRWMIDHVIEGRISGGQAQIEMPAGMLLDPDHKPIPNEALLINLGLENVAFSTSPGLPNVRGASGAAVLAGSTFGLDLQDGEMVLPSGRAIELTAAAYAIPNILERFANVQVEMQIAGEAAALAELADADPIHALKDLSVAPGDLSGRGTARLSAKWAMRPDITMSDVDWSVAAQATDFASRAQIVGRTVSKGDVTLNVNRDAVVVRGRAEIDGLPANLDLTFPLAPGGDIGGGRQQVRLVIDEAARQRLGMGLDGMLAGTVTAAMSDLGAGHLGQHYQLDLKDARVTLAPLGWSKGIGVPAMMSLDLVPDGGGFRLDNLVIDGPGFGMTGSARLDSGYGIVSADITRFALRRGDEISFKLTRLRGGYVIAAEGDSFDIRGMVAALLDAGDTAEGAPDLTVSAKVTTLIGFNDQTLTGADFRLAAGADGVRSMSLKAQLAGTRVEGAYAQLDTGVSLDLFIEDSGAALRFLDFYNHLQGGRLTIAGRGGVNGIVGGTVDLAGFAIVDEPSMQRLLGASPPDDGGVRRVNPNRVDFERAILNFSMHGSQIAFNDGLLRGIEIGATWSGIVDFASSRLQMAGTYLPAYRVNNIFGQIPILGLALGGGNREGLLGVTFKVEGPFSDLRLSINPLSAIAPGIFRKIFEFQ